MINERDAAPAPAVADGSSGWRVGFAGLVALVGSAGMVVAFTGLSGVIGRVGWGYVGGGMTTTGLLGVLAASSVVCAGLILSATTLGPLALWAGATVYGVTAGRGPRRPCSRSCVTLAPTGPGTCPGT